MDQGIVDVIARLLTGLMRETATEAEVTSLTTMALEIVTVLFNPDICVNALLPVTQRVIDDCPSVKEVGLGNQCCNAVASTDNFGVSWQHLLC